MFQNNAIKNKHNKSEQNEAEIKNNGEETDDEQFRDSESKTNFNISKLTPISLVAKQIKRSRRKKR